MSLRRPDLSDLQPVTDKLQIRITKQNKKASALGAIAFGFMLLVYCHLVFGLVSGSGGCICLSPHSGGL